LTFKSPINGGVPQTFTIEYSTPGNNWNITAMDIADRHVEKNLVRKITGLKCDTIYEFRVKSVNKYGPGNYGDILKLKTKGISRRISLIRNDWARLNGSEAASVAVYPDAKLRHFGDVMLTGKLISPDV
jgi:hypothetical protein